MEKFMTNKLIGWLTAHGVNLASFVGILHYFPQNKWMTILNVVIAALLKSPLSAGNDSK
jgi:hypothetical protein